MFAHRFRAEERHSLNTLHHFLRGEFTEESSVRSSAIPLVTLSKQVNSNTADCDYKAVSLITCHSLKLPSGLKEIQRSESVVG